MHPVRPVKNQLTLHTHQQEDVLLMGRYRITKLLSSTSLADFYHAIDLQTLDSNSELSVPIIIAFVNPVLNQLTGFPSTFFRVLSKFAKNSGGLLTPTISDYGTMPEGILWFAIPTTKGILLSDQIKQVGRHGLPTQETLNHAESILKAVRSTPLKDCFGYLEPGAIWCDGSHCTLFSAPIAITLKLLTDNNQNKGKITLQSNFLSPEVSMGSAPKTQDDTFSLASIIYYMLNGHLPFVLDSSIEAAVKNTTPATVAKLSHYHWLCLQRGLSYQREHRQPNPDDLLFQLSNAEVQPKKNYKQLLGSAGIALALSAITYIGYYIFDSQLISDDTDITRKVKNQGEIDDSSISLRSVDHQVYTQQKDTEELRLAELKKQQEREALHLTEIQKQQAIETQRLLELQQNRQIEESLRLQKQQQEAKEAVRLAELKKQQEAEEALRLAQLQKQQEAEEALRLTQLQKQQEAEEALRLTQLQKQREAEEALRLAELKKQQEAEEALRLAQLQKQREAEEALRLAELKKQQEAEEALRLAQLQKQREAEEALRLAQLQKQREAEEALRLAQLQKQREAEEALRLAQLQKQREAEEALRLAQLQKQREAEEALRLAAQRKNITTSHIDQKKEAALRQTQVVDIQPIRSATPPPSLSLQKAPPPRLISIKTDARFPSARAFGLIPPMMQADADHACQRIGAIRAIGYHPNALQLDGSPYPTGAFYCFFPDTPLSEAQAINSTPSSTPPRLAIKKTTAWNNPGAFGSVPVHLQNKGNSICQRGGFSVATGYHPEALDENGQLMPDGGYLCQN